MLNSWLQKGRNSVLVSFILLALIGGWAIKASADSSTEKLYQTQIESCERGNLSRTESNNRIQSNRTDTEVLRNFLLDASVARQAAYEANGEETDLRAAKAYTQGARRLAGVKFDPLPIINCQKVVRKP